MKNSSKVQVVLQGITDRKSSHDAPEILLSHGLSDIM